ncbi:DUF4276 family protein [Brenneria goodwinii]|uniref:DUF4276 family protein n=1 Tax=Brenneria goodwinii TaxID=1109412 RepID=UPI0036EFAEEE
MINITIATEDVLSESIISKILSNAGKFKIVMSLGKQGCGYLINKLNNFNNLAKTCVVLVVIDLDNNKSHDEYIEKITKSISKIDKNLVFSVPIKEVESWILADKSGLSKFLNISENKIDRDPDTVADPKEKIIYLAKNCKNRSAKNGIPPKPKEISKVGLSYNTVLVDFVNNHWSIERASNNSPSLRRTLELVDSIS